MRARRVKAPGQFAEGLDASGSRRGVCRLWPVVRANCSAGGSGQGDSEVFFEMFAEPTHHLSRMPQLQFRPGNAFLLKIAHQRVILEDARRTHGRAIGCERIGVLILKAEGVSYFVRSCDHAGIDEPMLKVVTPGPGMHDYAQVRVQSRKLHADSNRSLPAASLLDDKTMVKILRDGLLGLAPDLGEAVARDSRPGL